MTFFTKATEAWPPAKQQLTIRLDADVLNWLKANGRGYQTRINRILRAAMESQPPRRSRSTPAPKKGTDHAAHSNPRDVAQTVQFGRIQKRATLKAWTAKNAAKLTSTGLTA